MDHLVCPNVLFKEAFWLTIRLMIMVSLVPCFLFSFSFTIFLIYFLLIFFVDPDSMKAQALLNAQDAVLKQENKVYFNFIIT